MDARLGSGKFEETEELQHLRRRAYGPDADIAGDAAAQARLSELEATRRRHATPVVGVTAAVPAPIPERAPAAEFAEEARSASTSVRQAVVHEGIAEHEPPDGRVTAQAHTARPIAEFDPDVGTPARPGWRRRRTMVLFGGAVAALALTAGAIAWLSQQPVAVPSAVPAETSTADAPHLPGGLSHGYYVPAPDYVLTLLSVGADSDEPNDPYNTLDALGISRDELTRYENFRGPDVWGFNVWSGESRYGMTCLLVAVSGQGIRDGLSGEACSLKGLDTSVDLPPNSGGGLYRFVLRGDQVNVYVYESGADPNAS